MELWVFLGHIKIAECKRQPTFLLHSVKFINPLKFMVNVDLFGTALSGHSFQKLSHVPDLLIVGRLTGFDKSASVLIVQGPLEQVDFAFAQTAGKCIQRTLGGF